MPLLKLKSYGVAILAIVATVLYALFKNEKTKRYKDKARIAQKTTEALTEANKAISEAEKRGKEKLNAKDPDRSHFN